MSRVFNITALEVSNKVLALYRPGCGFYIDVRGLKIRNPRHDLYVKLENGGMLLVGSDKFGMGGTMSAATAQLVRWIRDEPRRGMGAWRYWCGEQVSIGRENDKDIIKLLEDNNYADPDKTCCIFCKRPPNDPPRMMDWWDLSPQYTGPGCMRPEKDGCNIQLLEKLRA